mmetsp:Transcript_5475/g.11959  ORF Transcript_5475/g.11959 Transcript_5475/m.11959 type:complete len:215 (-) Transcript_5475:21-665(-)
MSRGRGCLLVLLALALQTMNGLNGFYRSTCFRARFSLLARKVHTSREPSPVNPLSKSAKSNIQSIKSSPKSTKSSIKSNIKSSPAASASTKSSVSSVSPARSVKSSYPARAGSIKVETNLGLPKPAPAQAPLSQSEEAFVCLMRDCRQASSLKRLLQAVQQHAQAECLTQNMTLVALKTLQRMNRTEVGPQLLPYWEQSVLRAQAQAQAGVWCC